MYAYAIKKRLTNLIYWVTHGLPNLCYNLWLLETEQSRTKTHNLSALQHLRSSVHKKTDNLC